MENRKVRIKGKDMSYRSPVLWVWRLWGYHMLFCGCGMGMGIMGIEIQSPTAALPTAVAGIRRIHQYLAAQWRA